METYMVLVLNITCILLAVIGTYKVPLSAIFGLIISITVLSYQLIDVGFSDIGLRIFTVVTIIICMLGFIGGYNKNG